MMERNEGISFTALREIGVLQEIKHPNIVKVSSLFSMIAVQLLTTSIYYPHVEQLYEVYAHKGSVFLVFECMETDLAILIKNVLLSPSDIKVLTCMSFVVDHETHPF